MSWRDRYQVKGKFRDAEFIVMAEDLEPGRRVTVHEFPKRDDPVVEDMGKKKHQYTLNVVVVGPDYDYARNKLIDALDQPGSGDLIHPTDGKLRVSIIDSRETQTTTEGGMARFTITYIVVGNHTYNFEQVDTAEAVAVEADKTLAECILDFSNNFDVLNQISDLVDEVQGYVEDVLSAVETVVSGITDPIASLIRSPAEMASAFADSLGSLSNSLQSPFRALDIYKTLFNNSIDTSSIQETTSNRVTETNNIDAVEKLVKRISIAEAARTVSVATWQTVNDVIEIRDAILDAIDDQMDTDLSDGVYDALSALRAALVEDVRIRVARLPQISHFIPNATLPAVVIAYHLHNDAARESEIISRNNVRHPGFVPGGKSLEYINDV